jgi:hypothetical protein
VLTTVRQSYSPLAGKPGYPKRWHATQQADRRNESRLNPQLLRAAEASMHLDQLSTSNAWRRTIAPRRTKIEPVEFQILTYQDLMLEQERLAAALRTPPRRSSFATGDEQVNCGEKQFAHGETLSCPRNARLHGKGYAR